jgi:hypothetical protein
MTSVLYPVRPLKRPPADWKELQSQIGGAVNTAMLETYDGPPLPFGWLDKFRKALVVDLGRRKVLRTYTREIGVTVTQQPPKLQARGSNP